MFTDESYRRIEHQELPGPPGHVRPPGECFALPETETTCCEIKDLYTGFDRQKFSYLFVDIEGWT